LFLLALVVMSFSGCGGDDALFTQASVEDKMTAVLNAGGGSQWQPVEPVECEKQEDDLHWMCTTVIASMSDPAERSNLSVRTLCVEETERCHRTESSVFPYTP
jgi:hypothetical protein